MKKIIPIVLALSLLMCSSKEKLIKKNNPSLNLNSNKEILTIKSIDSFNSSKVYVIKALNNKNKLFKIISTRNEDNKEIRLNCNHIKIGQKYSFELFSVFSGISLGNHLTTYTIYDVDISIEPENSIDDLYNTYNLDGLCPIP